MTDMTKRISLIASLALLVAGICWISSVQAKPTALGAKGWLGVYVQTVDDDLAEGFELSVTEGAVINDIVRKSPADVAGLEEDDIIIAINSKTVSDQMDVTRAVRKAKPGDKMTLTVMRGDKKMDFNVTLAAEPADNRSRRREREVVVQTIPPMHSMPGMPDAPSAPGAPEMRWFSNDDEDGGMIGITMTPLTEQLGGYFGVTDGEGALITEVLAGTTAEKAGVRAGDVIIAVDGDQVSDVCDVAESIGEKDVDDVVKLTIIRDKKQMELSVTVGEDDRSPRSMGSREMDGVREFKFFAPRMRGLHHGGADRDMLDIDELRENRAKIRKELDQLRKEIDELKKGK
jgi:serine protease Do